MMTTEEIAVKVVEIDQRSKSNTHRLDALEGQVDAVNRLATSVEVLVTENKHQTETIKEIKTNVSNLDKKVETIEQKPAKKWDSMAEKVLWTLFAAVIGFALAYLGIA